MRAVYDSLDSLRACQVANLLYRCDLTREVHLMRNENEFCSIGDSSFESSSDLVEVLRRDWNLHHLQHKTFATLALTQCVQHARIILSRRENFISGLEIHSHEKYLQ